MGGLLIGSDTCIDTCTCIMAKIDAIWLTFVSFGPVVTLKIQSKVQKLTAFILHYTCIPVNMVTVITLD